MARTKKQILEDARKRIDGPKFDKDYGDMSPAEMWDASHKIKKHNAKKRSKKAMNKVSNQFNGTFPKKRPDYVKVGNIK